MRPLWQQYVFHREQDLYNMWDDLFDRRPIRLLYITGRGFDIRAQSVMQAFVENIQQFRPAIKEANLLLIGFEDYQLNPELESQTEENALALQELFSAIGETQTISISSTAAGEDDITPSNALRLGVEKVLERIQDQTDIILDISSLPRVTFLALMTGVLDRLMPNKKSDNPLSAEGVNFQVLVAEDAILDGKIRSEDPRNDLVLIPGFSSALHAESVQDWPLVWFPVLGENKVSQLQKVMATGIPSHAEICPVLPLPSRDPRRADRLLVEYRESLFDARETATGNILYAHEAHPFAAYRQLLRAMDRYRNSMRMMGGCRLVVTPLASKLMTIGAGLACFEMRPANMDENYGVAIPFAEPTRYVVLPNAFRSSRPELSGILLTGQAYQ